MRAERARPARAPGAACAGSGSGSPRSSRASRASRSRLGPWRGGSGSSTTPPPSVSGGASERITRRSPRGGHERLLEAELEVAAAELREPGGRLARAVVHGDARAAVGPRVGGDPGEGDVDAEASGTRGALRRRPRRRLRAHLVAADAGQVERHPLAGLGALARLVVDLHGADAGGRPAGRIRTSSPRAAAALPQRAGDHRAGAADRERAVDVQAQRAAAAAAGQRARRRGRARRAARRAPRRAGPRPARSRRRAAAPPPPRSRARGRRGRPS